MSYPAFPNIGLPSYAYEEEAEDPGISSQMENGSVISRARFTKSRLKFTLKYILTYEQKETLLDFYRNTAKGSSSLIEWVHPDTKSEFYNQTFNVRFAEPLKLPRVAPNYWSVQIVLMEG